MSERPWSERIGEQIRELREAHGMTQAELGERLGISRQSISELEKGRTGLTLGRLERILNAFDYELEMFFVRQED